MGKQVSRLDITEFRGAERTPQGFLRAPAYATRVGVLKYRRADGSMLRELRHPDEVFKAESLATLANVPLTNNHPTTMLDSKNARFLTVGWTGDNIERDGKFVKTKVTITDEEAIKDVESGKQEVSCGYRCELEEQPGMYDGEEYDVVQKNIRYNHLALVDRGRAGREVRIKLDSAEDAFRLDGADYDRCVAEVSKDPKVDNPHAVCNSQMGGKKDGPEEGQKMKKMKIGEKEYDLADDAFDAVTAELTRVKKDSADEAKAATQKDADKALADEKKRADQEQARADAAAEALKNLKAERADCSDEKKIREQVKARSRLDRIARLSLKDVSKLDDMSDREVKEAVIKAQSPTADLKDKSDDYVTARFDAASEQFDAGDKKVTELGKKIVAGEQGAADGTAESARKKMLQSSMDEWKQPLSAAKTELKA